MQLSVVIAASLFATSLAVAHGCSAASIEEPAIKAMDPSPPPQESALDAGCTPILSVTNGTSCRADWVCSDAGTLTFECVPSGGTGTSCACISDMDASVDILKLNPCQTTSLGKLASSLCNWDVP